MAKQTINIGSSANDGTGTTIRAGGDLINDNFNEIYTYLGDGTNLNGSLFSIVDESSTESTINVGERLAITGGTNLTSAVSGDSVNITLNSSITGITSIQVGTLTTSSGNLLVNPATQILEVRGAGSTEGQIQLNCRANSHGQKIIAQPHSEGVTNEMLLPKGGNSTLVSEVATQTLTNKTLTSPDINTPDIDGGAIDGAVIGANTPAAITGTAISGTSVTVTGTAGAMTLNTVTTSQRNAISSPANGMIVYNSTDSKIQAYVAGSWVNLH